MKKLLALSLIISFASFACLDDGNDPKTSQTESQLTICDTEPAIVCPITDDPPDCHPKKCDKDLHCWVCVHPE